jgi:threonine/homoserine/homoserine lactone efflux protein
MMALRVVCLLAAVAVVQVSIWLSLVIIAGGAILPWCAVLIANDRPPRKREHVSRFRSGPQDRMLPPAAPPAADPHIIEG